MAEQLALSKACCLKMILPLAVAVSCGVGLQDRALALDDVFQRAVNMCSLARSTPRMALRL